MEHDVPLISVCMPVYDAERHLAQAVESILGQTLGDFEFLIIDDGSTDGSREILRRYAARDPRIRLTSRPNKGLARTLQELVSSARGEFIARMDADDVALPDRLAKEAEYLRAHPECVLVGCRVWEADTDSDPLCEYPTAEGHDEIDAFHFRMKGPALVHPSVMMRRDAVLAAGNYRDFPIGEDVNLFLRLAERGRLARVPEFLLIYRIHEGNYSRTPAAAQRTYATLSEILTDAYRRRGLPATLPPPPDPPRPSPPSPERDRAWAWRSLLSGHRRTALKYARRVLSRHPLSPQSWRLMYCALRGR